MTMFHQQRFAKGEHIIEQGVTGDRTFVIRRGNVLVCHEDSDGSLIPIKELGPGEVFGEMYLYNEGTTRNATVVAVNEVMVDVVFDEYYREEMSRLSPFQKIMIQGMNQRLNETTEDYLDRLKPKKDNPGLKKRGPARSHRSTFEATE